VTTPESHARIRRSFDELVELPPAEREQRARALDLEPAECEELLALLSSGNERSLTGLAGFDATAVIEEAELRPLRERPPAGFELEEIIGRGGMGVVFRARQLEPPRAVALKVLSVRRGGAEATRTANREAAVLARLRHPGVAQVIAAGTLDQGGGLLRPWYALELVEGARGLVAYAEEQGLDRRARLRLMRTVCAAVHHGHQKGVLHGDIKPANVLVDAEGRVKVIDFGVARLLGDEGEDAPGPVGGTPRYMAPELRLGAGGADVRTDVYALGAMLAELVHATPDRELDWIVAKAMAPTPDERYPSVAALADELGSLLADRPVTAAPASLGYPTRKFARRNARSLTGLVLTLALAGIGGINGLRARVAEREAKFEHERASDEARRAFWLLRDATLAVSSPYEQGRSPEARAHMFLARLAAAGPALDAPASHESDRQMLVGFGYQALGDLEAAQVALMRATTGYTELGVPEDPRLYLAYSQLAEVELERGRPVAADVAARAALAALPPTRWPARERALPASLLARALLAQGSFGEAELLADEVLALGVPGEPGRVALALARLWARAGRALEPDVRQAVDVLLVESEQHPPSRIADEVAIQRLAAGALAAAGDVVGARELLMHAQANISGQLRENHPLRMALDTALQDLGGTPSPADDPHVEAARARVEDQIVAFNALVRSRNVAQLAAALPELDALADEARTMFGPEDTLTDSVVLFQARALLADGRPGAALELLEGLHEAPARNTGLGPFLTGVYERVMAVALMELGRPAEAVPLAEECLRKARVQFRDGSRFVQMCTRVLEEARLQAGQ